LNRVQNHLRSNSGTTTLLMAAIVIGSLLGTLAPAFGERLGEGVDYTVIALVSILFFELRFERFRPSRGDMRFFAIAWAANFLIIPGIGFAIASVALPGQPLFAAGLIIYFMAPCTDWFLGFTRMAGGNTDLGSKLLPINMLSQLLLYPVYLTVFTHWQSGADLNASAQTLLDWFVVPALIAISARVVVALLGNGEVSQRATTQAGSIVPWVIALLIAEIFAANASTIGDHLSGFVRVLGAVFVFFVATYVLGDGISRFFRLHYPEHVLLTMTTAARNAPLMLGITAAAIPDQPLIYAALVIGMLVEFPHLTLLKHLLLRKQKGSNLSARPLLVGHGAD
jgi:ACR3 family arsenite efflux pump ArsB